MPELEYCIDCYGETGNAGIGEDSLYDGSTQEGPLCQECYDERHSNYQDK